MLNTEKLYSFIEQGYMFRQKPNSQVNSNNTIDISKSIKGVCFFLISCAIYAIISEFKSSEFAIRDGMYDVLFINLLFPTVYVFTAFFLYKRMKIGWILINIIHVFFLIETFMNFYLLYKIKNDNPNFEITIFKNYDVKYYVFNILIPVSLIVFTNRERCITLFNITAMNRWVVFSISIIGSLITLKLLTSP